jgi:tetratricopeptide (TPR) repeat protein
MRAAAAAFAQAVAADRGFHLAAWRHVWAASFHELPVDSAIAASLNAHVDDLPRPDRLLLEARRTPGIPERLARLESLLQQYPDHWQGWFELAEQRLREAPFAGGFLAEAEGPLRRALGARPRFVPAWDRLTWLALERRDTVASARALAALQRLRYDSTSRLDGDFDMLLFYRHLHHLARTGGVPDAAPTDSLSRAFAGGRMRSRFGTPERIRSGIARYGFHAARIDFARRQIRDGAARPFQLQVIANSWAARGGWDSAIVVADSAARANAKPIGILLSYRLVAIGVWLGAVDTVAGADWRRRGATVAYQLPPAERAELAWTDGLLAGAQRDARALARARETLRGSGAPEVGRLDSSLAAFGRELAGDRRGAIALLVALELDRHRPSTEHPYVAGVNRLVASRWLAAEGDTSRAMRLLTWSESIGFSNPQSLHAETVLAPFSHLARARLLAARGDRDAARAQYRHFLALYDAPVPAVRPLVEEARSAR